ncbi:WcbI family polysaccharide biosynthesis putative acetyltransferase [Litorihabitans aurantiacus]|uniref:Polysaccharide biosynthesis enzyme WcbI domain-containing protein n=1 Tax=Litorihabitans aurantiacus TaxID=1930061 RepID=A0AA37XE81_9MICO|nr:WcbI family polysaccharide biosynthesis putative acetyltransferase [Litorihabitans aurantiacus]GMA31519.1 hypothetical protein GCM10025875_15110 [Litorihabitans aurantiacus]
MQHEAPPDHLARFHDDPDHADDAVGRDGRPLGLVVGNCQAESLRIALGDELDLVRTPPVHELTRSDLPHLTRLLGRADVLVTQPVRDDYRDLPVGTRQLEALLRPGARTVRVPVIRFAGLHPHHAIVRPPSDTSLVPPLVAYHDLRVLSEAAGHPLPPTAPAAAVREIARESLEQLRRREAAHGTVVVHDLFTHPDFAQMRTLNHPGNPVWEALAARVADALGIAAPPPLTRPLLASVHAPREAHVIEAWGLADEPRPDWVVDGRTVTTGQVREAHLDFYARHPDAVAAGLERHAGAIAVLAGAGAR